MKNLPEHLYNISEEDHHDFYQPNLDLNGFYHLPVVILIHSLIPLINKIIAHNRDKDVPYIQILCNSYGGSTYATTALIDVMEISKIPIHTVALGTVSSAGSLIFTCGTKGHRTVLPNARIMTHVMSSFNTGTHWEQMHQLEEYKKIHSQIVNIYATHTKIKDFKKAEQFFTGDYDKYFSAKEAISCGLADKIATSLTF